MLDKSTCFLFLIKPYSKLRIFLRNLAFTCSLGKKYYAYKVSTILSSNFPGNSMLLELE